MPFDPAYSRREEQLGAYVAVSIWVLNVAILVGLLLWVAEWSPVA